MRIRGTIVFSFSRAWAFVLHAVEGRLKVRSYLQQARPSVGTQVVAECQLG